MRRVEHRLVADGVDAPLANGAQRGQLLPDAERVFGEAAGRVPHHQVEDDIGVERDHRLLLHLAPALARGRRDGLAPRDAYELCDEAVAARRVEVAQRARHAVYDAEDAALRQSLGRQPHRLDTQARLFEQLPRGLHVAGRLPDQLDGLVCVFERLTRHGERPDARGLDLVFDELRLRVGEDDEVGTERGNLLHVRVVPAADARELLHAGRISAVVRDGNDALKGADAEEYLRRAWRKRDDARGPSSGRRRKRPDLPASPAEQEQERDEQCGGLSSHLVPDPLHEIQRDSTPRRTGSGVLYSDKCPLCLYNYNLKDLALFGYRQYVH